MSKIVGDTLFARMLVPLDGSPEAESILYQAQKLLCGKKGEVLLFHVLDAPSEVVNPGKAEKYLARVEKRLTAYGARVRRILRSGPVDSALLDTIRSERISLVALSSHGGQTSANTPLAGIVETVVQSSDVPVFLSRAFEVGPDGTLVPSKCEPSNIRRILVPLDGSSAGEAVIPYVRELALMLDALVVILHVDPERRAGGGEWVGNRGTGVPRSPGKESSPDERIAFVAGTFSAAGLETMSLSLGGDPATTILEFARPSAVDLIAMATQERGGPTAPEVGPVAKRVLQEALLPTLLVRANGGAGAPQREGEG